jgi:hypothetical protein
MAGSRKHAPRRLGDVLRELTASLGIDDKLMQGRVVDMWYEILGERMAGQIESARVKGDRLYVRVKSPAWRQEIHLRRGEWMRRLNEELGRDVISEIVIR